MRGSNPHAKHKTLQSGVCLNMREAFETIKEFAWEMVGLVALLFLALTALYLMQNAGRFLSAGFAALGM